MFSPNIILKIQQQNTHHEICNSFKLQFTETSLM